MENKPSGGVWGPYFGMAVLTAASCLHDLIYEDMLSIDSGIPAVENCFKCTFAVRYLAAAK